MSEGPRSYYDDGDVRIYHGDCLEVLPLLSDVGVVITSPPYNLGRGLDDRPVEAMHNRPSAARSSKSHKMTENYDEHDDAMPLGEYREWQHDVLSACWSALRSDGAIFYNHKPRVQAGRLLLPTEFVPPGVDLRQVIIAQRGRRPVAVHAGDRRGRPPLPVPDRPPSEDPRLGPGQRPGARPLHGQRDHPASGEGRRAARHRHRPLGAVLRDRRHAARSRLSVWGHGMTANYAALMAEWHRAMDAVERIDEQLALDAAEDETVRHPRNDVPAQHSGRTGEQAT